MPSLALGTPKMDGLDWVMEGTRHLWFQIWGIHATLALKGGFPWNHRKWP